MAAEKIRLSEAIDDFLLWRKADGKATQTIRNNRNSLRPLLLTAGDMYFSSIAGRHLDRYFMVRRETRSNRSLGIDHATLQEFFRWGVKHRYVGRFENPMEGRRAPRWMPTEHQRVHMRHFPSLLDAAEAHHARDRAVIALGLYLLLRGGEISTLRRGDVSLDSLEVRVRIWKTREVDRMPVSLELAEELRRWLTWYSIHHGPLQRDWYLVPAKQRCGFEVDEDGRPRRSPSSRVLLSPERKIANIEEVAQRAFARTGVVDLRDETGKSLREGMHTLRRSGARALFDSLEYRGYDGAIRQTQAMLHHKTIAQTEEYIGLTLDKHKRNELIRGQRMYGTDENVVDLRPALAE